MKDIIFKIFFYMITDVSNMRYLNVQQNTSNSRVPLYVPVQGLQE